MNEQKARASYDAEMNEFFDGLRDAVKDMIEKIISDAMDSVTINDDGSIEVNVSYDGYLSDFRYRDFLCGDVWLCDDMLRALLEKHPAVELADRETIEFKDLDTLRALGLTPVVRQEYRDEMQLGGM